MKDILIASFSTALAMEIVLAFSLKSRAAALIAISSKSSRVLLSKRISDHWKEIILLRYSQDIMKQSFIILSVLTGIIAALLVPAFVYDKIFTSMPTTIDFFLSLWGQIYVVSISIIYLVVRNLLASH